MGSSESTDAGLPGLAEHERYQHGVRLTVSGDGPNWTSLLGYVRPGSNTTDHHVVDLAAALSSAGIWPTRTFTSAVAFPLDDAGQELGLDRVRLGARTGWGRRLVADVSITDAQDRVTGLSVTFDEAMSPAEFHRPRTWRLVAAGDGGPVGGRSGGQRRRSRRSRSIFSNPQALGGTYPVTIGPEVLDRPAT